MSEILTAGKAPLSSSPRESLPDVLCVGDPAPSLPLEEWLVGQPIDQFQPGMVYILDFWATWCRLCVASIPHLSDLQTKYKEKLVVIGIIDEPADDVQKFLDKPAR